MLRKLSIICILICILFSITIFEFNSNKVPHSEISHSSQTTNNKNINSVDINVDKSYIPINSSNSSITRNFKGNHLKYNNKSIPVLMYHSIPNKKGNEIELSKQSFEKQMNFLSSHGYTTLSLDELYNFLIYNKSIPEKSVIITFDDGYINNYFNAYPILKKFNFKAVIFVITNLIDNNKNYLTSSQLKEMNANGIDIQSHTVNHDDLSKLDYTKQFNTLMNSKKFLEKLLNKNIDYIAYPFGNWNKTTLKALKNSGYKMAFTTNGTWSNISNGIYSLNRVYISSNFDINEFENRISNINYK